MWYVARGKAYKNTASARDSPHTFSRLWDWSRIFVTKKTRSRPEASVLVELDE